MVTKMNFKMNTNLRSLLCHAINSNTIDNVDIEYCTDKIVIKPMVIIYDNVPFFDVFLDIESLPEEIKFKNSYILTYIVSLYNHYMRYNNISTIDKELLIHFGGHVLYKYRKKYFTIFSSDRFKLNYFTGINTAFKVEV